MMAILSCLRITNYSKFNNNRTSGGVGGIDDDGVMISLRRDDIGDGAFGGYDTLIRVLDQRKTKFEKIKNYC